MLSHVARVRREPGRLESMLKKMAKHGKAERDRMEKLCNMIEPTEELSITQRI